MIIGKIEISLHDKNICYAFYLYGGFMSSLSNVYSYCVDPRYGWDLSFIPYKVEKRAHVPDLLKSNGIKHSSQWDATMKAATIYEQQVIIQDLLLFGVTQLEQDESWLVFADGKIGGPRMVQEIQANREDAPVHCVTARSAVTALAAELFIRLNIENSRDFFLHILPTKRIFTLLHTSLISNHMFHEYQESEKAGSSGLSRDQLLWEKILAGRNKTFDKV